MQDNTSIQDEISRYFLFLKDDFTVLDERIEFLTKFHDMIKRYLQEKEILKKEKLAPKTQISNKEIRGFRRRISKQFDLEKKRKSMSSSALRPLESSLLTNYLRKQRLQEYQSNTKYYQENPFKSSKKQANQQSFNLFSSSVLKKMEKISEDEEGDEKDKNFH